jgi:Protein of unknown function (DUF1638)
MSSSPTAPTSTTGSSTSSPSSGGSGGSPPRASRAVEVIACGALAAHIREIAARCGWPLVVRPLPARLHNRPEKITQYSERARSSAPTVMAYADCGTYGKLDEFCTANDIPRLPGLHCYDIFAGQEVIAKLFDEEPGTYLLTDYLVRTFDRTVLASLGLDKHPDLWPDYFAHYTRVIWLAQAPTPHLEAEAQRIANLFALPLTTIPTGLGGLESALADLIADAKSVPKDSRRNLPQAPRHHVREKEK